jgi:hypothetical protein
VVAGKAIVEFSKELHGVSVRGVPLSVKERRREEQEEEQEKDQER